MLSFEKDMYSDFVAKTFQYLELVQCKSCNGIFSINISKNKETKIVNLKVRCPGCKITSFEGRPYEYFSLNMIETAFLEGITYNHIKDSVLHVFSLYFSVFDQEIKNGKMEKRLKIEFILQCKTHNLHFDYYCTECKKNICIKCKSEFHPTHKVLLSQDLMLQEEIEKNHEKFDIFLTNVLTRNEMINREVDKQLTQLASELHEDKDKREINDLLYNHKIMMVRYECDIRCFAALYQLYYKLCTEYPSTAKSSLLMENLFKLNKFVYKPFDLSFMGQALCSISEAKALFAKEEDFLSKSLIITGEDVTNNKEMFEKGCDWSPPIAIDPISYKAIYTKKYGDNHILKIKQVLLLSASSFIVCSGHTTIKQFGFKLDENDNIYKFTKNMKYKYHKDAVNYLELENENYFLSCSDDKTVMRWKITASPLKYEFKLNLINKKNKPQIIEGHSDKVIKVIMLNDGDSFCSCSYDKTIRFYTTTHDEQEPKFIKTAAIAENGDFVSMIDIGNKTLAIAFTDNILRFFDYSKYRLLPDYDILNCECIGVRSLVLLGTTTILVGGKGYINYVDICSHKIMSKYDNNFIGNIEAFFPLNPSCTLAAGTGKILFFGINGDEILLYNSFSSENSQINSIHGIYPYFLCVNDLSHILMFSFEYMKTEDNYSTFFDVGMRTQ